MTKHHASKDKAFKLRPPAPTASKHATSINEPRPPNAPADGHQPGGHVDTQARKVWNERDRPDVENRE